MLVFSWWYLMIIDELKNIKRYEGLNTRLKTAIDYILKTDFKESDCGRYEIEGDLIYANIEEYTTKVKSKPEYHKKYIDIQMLAKGEEYIGYCPRSEIVEEESFDEKKDIGFGYGVVDFVKLKKNQFMMLFPEDAHQPCMAVGKPEQVKKIVVKVRVDG